MKKILLIALSTIVILSNITTISAAENSSYSYNHGDYKTVLNSVEKKDNIITTTFKENNELVKISMDSDLQYVCVNDKYYTFTDYNSALLKQAKQIYDNNINISLTEVLNNYNSIHPSQAKAEIQLKLTDSGIMPLASYGTYYLMGTYKKLNYTAALTAGAISVAIGFFTGGLGFVLSTAAVKTFLGAFLSSLGVDYLTCTAYYKKWQAILNSHGTTSERRKMGAQSDNGNIFWDSKYYYRQFETQRPV